MSKKKTVDHYQTIFGEYMRRWIRWTCAGFYSNKHV